LAQLPRGAAVRKLNDLIKRARLAKVHAFILEALHAKMHSFFYKEKEQKKLIANLTTVYTEIAREKDLYMGDFPDPRIMQRKLASHHFADFKKIDPRKMQDLEEMLHVDVPRLLALIPQEQAKVEDATLTQIGVEASPFAVMKKDGADENTVYQSGWLVPPDPEEYRKEFEELDDRRAGKINGGQAKSVLVRSKLPSNVLHKIWSLADVDKDGCLNLYEFALAQHFIKMRLDGQDLPSKLPAHMSQADGVKGEPLVRQATAPSWQQPLWMRLFYKFKSCACLAGLVAGQRSPRRSEKQ